MTDPSVFLVLLRRASRRERLAPLVRALGFEPAAGRLRPPDLARLGVSPPAGGSVHRLGVRDGAEAFLLQSADGLDPADAGRAVRSLQRADRARHVLLVACDRGFARVAFLVAAPDGDVRTLVVEREHVRASDAETLDEMVAHPDDGPASLAVRHLRALDRGRVTRRFFEDFRTRRAAVAAAWIGVPRRATADREQLALLFLSRLLFLYFLQSRGHLAGDRRFLAHLVERWRASPGRGSMLRAVLLPLFFGALNRRPERRSLAARTLGDLPYLNGGLFERHGVERRYPELDLADDVVFDVFDGLLERYRFTARESGGSTVGIGEGIDPEMLGRVFEGVMSTSRRVDTGTFYTPAGTVDELVRDAIAAWLAPRIGLAAAEQLVGDADPRARADTGPLLAVVAPALAQVRVLDPACGSGAFLLGALEHIARIRASCSKRSVFEIRTDVVASSLHGVDVDGDAALLCALRLWLALAHEPEGCPVQPLPNLDRRIRQGDALLDPIDLAAGLDGPDRAVGLDSSVRRSIRALQPLGLQYLTAGPELRAGLRSRLEAAERNVARAWIDALMLRTARSIREAQAAAEARDLFGEAAAGASAAAAVARAAETRLESLARLARRLRDERAVPFFSFPVHFAETATRGFDLILSNPPWIRAHRWPAAIRPLVRQRYTSSGWRMGARLAGAPAAAGGQTDLAVLFLERALGLLAPGGVLGMLMPAKMLRSLYGGSARRSLLLDAPILVIRDFSLDQHAIFRADAFATSIVARRPDDGDATSPKPPASVDVTLHRRSVPPLRFAMPRRELPLFGDDPESPWLLAPEDARAAFRRMQRAGPPLAQHANLRVRRGVFTGANRVLLVPYAKPRLGDLASIRARGYESRDLPRTADDEPAAATFEDVVESACLRPLVRGADIDAWCWKAPGFVIWIHDDDGRPAPPPRRLARYLARHEAALARRSGAQRGFPHGALFRVTRDTLAPKVAWHDLSDTLRAVALPASVRSSLGLHGPLIPLNTVYFIPCRTRELCLLLAAFLNSTPIRTFARAVAERAKDARFRFFAWTVGALPLPVGWSGLATATPLLEISRQAHGAGGLDPAGQAHLDSLVARAFDLTSTDLDAIGRFHSWLSGQP